MTHRSLSATRPLVLAVLAVSLLLTAVVSRDAGVEAGPLAPSFGAITATLPAAETVGVVDPATGRWTLLDPAGNQFSFVFGNPGDYPFAGDWNCDGIATPGLYRQSDGFVYLRNSNTQGNADVEFFFGDPGDFPIAGDFNNDGCDTVSIYRPSNQTFYIINKLGSKSTGLGAAETFFVFGNPGDKPVTGDWDGDGITEIGLHRESTGFFYWRNVLQTGNADGQIFFGDPNDRFVAGDWGIVDGVDTPAVFRPSTETFYFRHTLTQGNADSTKVFGESTFLPVAGRFEALERTVSVAISGAPESLRAAVEQFYLLLEGTPGLPASFRDHLGTAGQKPGTFSFAGSATLNTILGQEVAVITLGTDVVLAAKSAGVWQVVGARLLTQGKSAWFGEGPTPGSPRRVMVIGADNGDPDPTRSRADAPHILTARAADGKATIIDLPRSILVQTNYGIDGIHHSMAEVPPTWTSGGVVLWSPPPDKPFFGPGETATAVGNTLGLPLEGYILTDFTMFTNLIDTWTSAFGSAYSAVLPWSSNTTGANDCPRDGGNIGCIGPGNSILSGGNALTWARERTPQLNLSSPYFGLPSGGIDRVEGHGYLIRAAAAKVQVRNIHDLPALLALLDDFVVTDLTGSQLLTLGAITWQLPPIDLSGDLTRTVDPALPNVVLNGCQAQGTFVGGGSFSPWTRPSPGLYFTLWENGRTFFPQVAATINDVVDGYWDTQGAKQTVPCTPIPGGWPVSP